MAYPYFGFTNAGAMPSQGNPLMNPGSQYLGAMPAGLGGVGASPMASITSQATPNMNAIMPLGMAGLSLMNAAHPGQQQSLGQSVGPLAMGAAGLMAKNPNMMQGLMGGIGSLFSGA